jgi:ACR3 family arsenite efflux pump ArsB
VAVPAATLPIFQIVFMVVYLRMAPRVRGWFQHGESTGLVSADGRPHPITR